MTWPALSVLSGASLSQDIKKQRVSPSLSPCLPGTMFVPWQPLTLQWHFSFLLPHSTNHNQISPGLTYLLILSHYLFSSHISHTIHHYYTITPLHHGVKEKWWLDLQWIRHYVDIPIKLYQMMMLPVSPFLLDRSEKVQGREKKFFFYFINMISNLPLRYH